MGPRFTRPLMASLAVSAAAVGVAACGGSAASTTTGSRTAGASVPLHVAVGPRGGVVVLAPVYINGRGPFPFVLDTGASRSVIDQRLARRLGFTIRPSHATLTGVNAKHAAGRITVSDWRIGNVRLAPQPVLTLPLAADARGPGLGGLIGSDNLRRFGSFLLNYATGRLILRARAG